MIDLEFNHAAAFAVYSVFAFSAAGSGCGYVTELPTARGRSSRNVGRNLYSFYMTTMSIAEASQAGVAALVAAAAEGRGTALSHHGKVVAEVVSSKEIAQLREDRDTLRDAALVMARYASDDGAHTTLDQAMESFNLNRAELEAENAEEIQSDHS